MKPRNRLVVRTTSRTVSPGRSDSPAKSQYRGMMNQKTTIAAAPVISHNHDSESITTRAHFRARIEPIPIQMKTTAINP